MDVGLAIEYARHVSRFIAAAAKSLAALASSSPQDMEELKTTLADCARLTKYSASENVDLVSDVDAILLQTASSCQDLSGQILRYFDHFHDDQHNSISDGELQILRDWLDRLRKENNHTFAAKLWSIVSHTVGELGAKNRRLAANRTDAIEDISSSLDAAFRRIRASAFHDDQTTDIWSEIQRTTTQIMDLETEQHVLAALQFRSMDRRKDLIAKEHSNTFQWILDTEAKDVPSRPVPTFVDWLLSDDPLYWISGKPGSGKSTLMKFVASNANVTDILRSWAKDDTLVTAAFYFWSAAKDPLQKSDAGLLRAILFQILSRCPDLIPHAYPEIWEKRPLSGLALRQFLNAEPTAAESLAIFQQLSAHLSSTKTRFCFFLDGLDEYDGDPHGLVDLIQSLIKNSNIKVCLSSRPWAEFEEAFGKNKMRKLYVHEFTKWDMRTYVADLLSANSIVKQHATRGDPNDLDRLITTLVDSADGVFLWVLLVVRDILSDLDATSTQIADLHHRLTSIPTNLDEYFIQVFQETKADLRQKTAEVFRISLDAVERLPLMCYWLIQHTSIDDLAQLENQPIHSDVAGERLAAIFKWLDTHSHGLLTSGFEVASDKSTTVSDQLFGFRVDFLHRTVADFLRTGNMERLLEKWSAGSTSIDVEICKASLTTVMLAPPTPAMFQDVSRIPLLLHIFMSHVRLIEADLQTQLIDQMLSALETHNESVPHLAMLILGPGNYWSADCSFTFAMFFHCISYDLGEYVSRHLDKNQTLFEEPVAALLVGCFSWDSRVRMGAFTIPVHTAELLLRKGLGPNVTWGDRQYSYWQQLVTTTYSRHLKSLVTQSDCDAVEVAIAVGADLDAPIEVFGSRAAITAMSVVEKFLPKEQFVAVVGGQMKGPH